MNPSASTAEIVAQIRAMLDENYLAQVRRTLPEAPLARGNLLARNQERLGLDPLGHTRYELMDALQDRLAQVPPDGHRLASDYVRCAVQVLAASTQYGARIPLSRVRPQVDVIANDTFERLASEPPMRRARGGGDRPFHGVDAPRTRTAGDVPLPGQRPLAAGEAEAKFAPRGAARERVEVAAAREVLGLPEGFTRNDLARARRSELIQRPPEEWAKTVNAAAAMLQQFATRDVSELATT